VSLVPHGKNFRLGGPHDRSGRGRGGSAGKRTPRPPVEWCGVYDCSELYEIKV
jgi:hypothetical protein